MSEGIIPAHGGYQDLLSYATFKKGIENSDPAVAANVMIGLIKLTNYLLDRQLQQLETAFLREGGLRERMTRARLAERARQNRIPVSPDSTIQKA
jgi:four helix bundle suffix protein